MQGTSERACIYKRAYVSSLFDQGSLFLFLVEGRVVIVVMEVMMMMVVVMVEMVMMIEMVMVEMVIVVVEMVKMW